MGSSEKRNPLDANSLGGETSRGFDSLLALPARLQRYALARGRALAMLEHIEQQLHCSCVTVTEMQQRTELVKLAAELRECGGYLEFRHYQQSDRVRLARLQTCRRPLVCPLCAIRRGAKALKAYLDRYEVIRSENPGLRASLVTLTVKNGPDLGERFDHLKEGVRRLLERRRSVLKGNRGATEARKWLGLVGTYEFTNKGNGWHPHTHLIVLHREDLDHSALASEWQGITADSFIVDCRPLENPTDPGADFVEVFKYAVKFSDLVPGQTLEAWRHLRGLRLLYSAGLFRGVEVPESNADDLLEEPYAELFYRFIGGEYRFERVARRGVA